MFDLGAPELIIILVIIVLLFGPGRIAKTMGEVGKGIRSFKDSFAPTEDNKTDTPASPTETNNLDPK
jgi:sec-independent protein translocase protein TatA